MNILKLLFELFILYIVYKLIFDFIIPVYRTTKQVQRKMNEMNQQRQQMNQNDQTGFSDTHVNSRSTSFSPKAASDDYIDYEEIK